MRVRLTVVVPVVAGVLVSTTWALAELLLARLNEPTADRWATAGVLGIVCAAVVFVVVESRATGAPAPAPTFTALPWWASLSDPVCWPEELAEPAEDAPGAPSPSDRHLT